MMLGNDVAVNEAEILSAYVERNDDDEYCTMYIRYMDDDQGIEEFNCTYDEAKTFLIEYDAYLKRKD